MNVVATTTHAYQFRRDRETALMKALHLEDRKVKRVELVFEAGKPVRMIVHEYAQYEHLPELVTYLESVDWIEHDVRNDAPTHTPV